MTEQEQIEETCETIASMICEIYNPQCDEYEPHTCSHCYANTTKIGDFAEMLYNAGYRKADEVRRETAKKIFDALYQWLDLENTEKCGFATIQKFDLLKKFREIYQQLGTEIKE